MHPDIAEAHSSEQGIADGMQQHIGIGVSETTFVMGYLNAAEYEVSAFHKLMKIYALPYSE
jgi:hypothetical protein